MSTHSKKNPTSPISTKQANKPKTPQSNPTTPVTPQTFAAAVSSFPQFTPENAVGIIVSVKTICGEVVQGEIYAYEPSMNLLALYVSGGQHETSTRKSFKILNTNAITQVVSISLPPLIEGKNVYKMNVPFPDLSAPLPALNIDKIMERENEAYEERMEKLGYGVSTEAQYIFDALAKTLPCHWEEDTIVVLDEIQIVKPYLPQNVQGVKEQSVNQVRRMVEAEWRKLKQSKK